jgi:hypothetical protein
VSACSTQCVWLCWLQQHRLTYLAQLIGLLGALHGEGLAGAGLPVSEYAGVVAVKAALHQLGHFVEDLESCVSARFMRMREYSYISLTCVGLEDLVEAELPLPLGILLAQC